VTREEIKCFTEARVIERFYVPKHVDCQFSNSEIFTE